MKSSIRALAVASTGLLLLIGGPRANAEGHDTTRPDQVRNVSIVAASTQSLTVSWPAIARAGRYEVDMDTDLDMSDRRTAARVQTNSVTLSGLRPGQTYCFQVRAVAGTTAGTRSPRTCKPTIVDQGAETGAAYRVVTYNLCSVPCGNWDVRRDPAAALARKSHPDVIALQETAKDSGVDRLLARTYTLAQYKSAKMLLFRTSRFSLQRSGWIDLGRKHYAVWAELADKKNDGKRVIFTSAHFAATPDTVDGDAERRSNADKLLAGVREVNGAGLPVVFAGDFNSHRHRKFDSPAQVMNEAGYWDAYDLAEKLVRPNYNSANQKRLDPVIGNTWGDHVDHVWVKPGQSQVLKWRLVADLTPSGRYAAPLPSDHQPVFARVVVN